MMPKSRRRIGKSVRFITLNYLGFYRDFFFKLALALHPDKNGAPGADEAFKCEHCCYDINTSLSIPSTYVVVSKAFQLLSGMGYIFNCGF